MNDPFRAEAPVPSISSGYSLINNELNDQNCPNTTRDMFRANTNRVFNHYNDTNLIDDMISHDDIQPKVGAAMETQTEERKESHSIACGDDNI